MTTASERQLEQTRCGVCGLTHPFLTVCPFIAEQEVRTEHGMSVTGQRTRIVVSRTRYFERPELFKAVEQAISESPEPEPVKTGEGPVKKERIRRRITE